MRNSRRAAVAGIGVALVTLTLAWPRLRGAPCREEAVATIPAPAVAWRAVIVRRECGPSADVTTHLRVLRNGEGLGAHASTVLVADANGAASTDRRGVVQLQVRWAGPSTLEVEYDAAARTLARETLVRGIQVHFVPHYLPAEMRATWGGQLIEETLRINPEVRAAMQSARSGMLSIGVPPSAWPCAVAALRRVPDDAGASAVKQAIAPWTGAHPAVCNRPGV